MSRAVIGGVVAAVIAALTATAYFITTSSLEDKVKRDVRLRVARAQHLLSQNASLEMLGLLKRAEALARDPSFPKALGGTRPDPRQAENAFRRFRAGLAAGETRPDVLALTDKNGQLLALVSGDNVVTNPVPDTYLKDGKPKYPALGLALGARQITAEVWDYENVGPMRVAVAPVVDPDLDQVVGAVIVAYSITATQAREQQKLLGAHVAYFLGDRVNASSFGQKGDQATEQAQALAGVLFGKGMAKDALDSMTGASQDALIELDGESYWAAALRLPRFSTQPLPDDYPKITSGAMVMMSVDEEMASVGSVKLAILLVGLGSLVVALLGMYLTARQILGPLDEIELGINDIINGNLERSFRPVNSDLDGLANALNVMLARLLGRPEPGDEEYDDEGNVIRPQALSIDGGAGEAGVALSAKDAEAMALANEPELAYLRRLFDEYAAARVQTGEGADGLNYDTFVAKLKANEAQLVARYKCSSVRFKVVTKDGKVTLKPVPLA